jgi:hypothetical protein
VGANPAAKPQKGTAEDLLPSMPNFWSAAKCQKTRRLQDPYAESLFVPLLLAEIPISI